MRALVLGLVLVGCGDNIRFGTCEIGAVPPDATLQAISDDGSLLAYTSRGNLWVTPAQCDGVAPTNLGALSLARFCGHTLVAFANVASEDLAMKLVAWRPGLDSATTIAYQVDPGATHCSYDRRYFSTEAGDALGDGISTVTLTLVPTDTLVPRTVAELDKAHGRFTHDSRFFVFSGTAVGTTSSLLWRLPVEGGPTVQLAAVDRGGRWAITSDDSWVVFHRGGDLRKVRLSDGKDILLDAGNVYSVKGPELSVADDGIVVYIRTPTPTFELAAIPLDGGMRTVLDGSSTGSLRLVEQHPGIVFYSVGASFMIASTTGTQRGTVGGYVADHLGEKTLLLDGHTVSRVDDPSLAVTTLAEGIDQVVFDRTGRAIGLTAGSVEDLGNSSAIFDREIGAFLMSGDRRTIAGIVNEPAGGSSLMRAFLP